MREMSKSDDVHMVQQGKAKQKSKFKPKSNIRPQAKGQNQTARGIPPMRRVGDVEINTRKQKCAKPKAKNAITVIGMIILSESANSNSL